MVADPTSMTPIVCIGLLTGALLAAGCGGNVDPRGQRVAVRGAVFMDAQPLNRAIIVFSAQDGPDKVTCTASIRDGFYEIPAIRGPLTGKMRVEIRSETLDLEEFEAARGGDPAKRVDPRAIEIPARYNTKSELTANVTDDPAANKFDFRLESH